MTTGSRSIAMWSNPGRARALDRVNRPLPHPSSRTTGAVLPKVADQSSGPGGGSRLIAVRAHSDPGRIRPGIGTPNSRSISPGTGMGLLGFLPRSSSPSPRRVVHRVVRHGGVGVGEGGADLV